MEPHKIALIAGLAVGVYAGFKYAGRLVPYPPYSFILGTIRGNVRPSVIQIVNPSLSDRINLAAGAVGSIVSEFNDGLDTLHSLFGSNSTTNSTSATVIEIPYTDESGSDGQE